MNWFALRCRSNFEYVVAAALEGRGYSVFLPTIPNSAGRRRSNNKALFPGYVLARFDWLDRLPVLTVPGLLHIVGNGKQPLPIPEDEVDSLRIAINANLSVRKTPYVSTGEDVLVTCGPLAGARGIVCSAEDGQRLVVSISILQRSVSVELRTSWIQPLRRVAGAA